MDPIMLSPKLTQVPTEIKRPRVLHVRYRPRRLEQFWNYPRDRALSRLVRGIRTNNLAALLIFVGPFSGGKTTAATYLGQWSSCDSWKDNALPCGECSGCLTVVRGLGDLRCGFLEIDSSKGVPRTQRQPSWLASTSTLDRGTEILWIPSRRIHGPP